MNTLSLGEAYYNFKSVLGLVNGHGMFGVANVSEKCGKFLIYFCYCVGSFVKLVRSADLCTIAK